MERRAEKLVKAGGLFPNLHKHILDNFLRFAGIPEHTERH
jgi:hypothetical protein